MKVNRESEAARSRPAPRVTGILETCIYAENVERAARFYEDLFGFRRMASDERFCAFAVTGHGARKNQSPIAASVLLIFREGGTLDPVTLPGGVIPPHDGIAGGHFAFSIAKEDLSAWKQRLGDATIPIEGRVHWEHGGQSIYFRDPDQNLVELATPGTWPIY